MTPPLRLIYMMKRLRHWGRALVAARWKQWRVYFTDIQPTGIGPQRMPGFTGSSNAPMAGYPKVFNIEMDPHEDLNIGGLFGWVGGPALEAVAKYKDAQEVSESTRAQYHPLLMRRCWGNTPTSGWARTSRATRRSEFGAGSRGPRRGRARSRKTITSARGDESMNNPPKTITSALEELSAALCISEADFGGKVTIEGKDPVVASRHHIGDSTSVLLALFGMELAAIWKQRTGRSQDSMDNASPVSTLTKALPNTPKTRRRICSMT